MQRGVRTFSELSSDLRECEIIAGIDGGIGGIITRSLLTYPDSVLCMQTEQVYAGR